MDRRGSTPQLNTGGRGRKISTALYNYIPGEQKKQKKKKKKKKGC
jgi:hypothetical protein